MNRFLLSAMAVSLSLALVGTATAGGSHGHSGGSSSHGTNVTHYHGNVSHDMKGVSHDTKSFKTTQFYKGKDSLHWSSRCWDRRYGCYCYWCPSYSCYYYWCPPDDCYYPVTYCPYGRYCWDE